MRKRIEEVCSLKAGWLDGEGEDIDRDPNKVELVAQAISDKLGVLPGIFPTPEGYVSLEWSLDETADFPNLEIRV